MLEESKISPFLLLIGAIGAFVSILLIFIGAHTLDVLAEAVIVFALFGALAAITTSKRDPQKLHRQLT